MSQFALGIRGRLLIVLSALLLIPWFGYQFVEEMERLLREGQERALTDLARTAAALLQSRPGLLAPGELPTGSAGARARVPALLKPVTLDGHIEDWISQGADVRAYGAEHLVEHDGTWRAESHSYSHAVGRQDAHVYAFFAVTDDKVVYCPAGGEPRACDHLRITIMNPQGEPLTYLVSAVGPGALKAARVDRSAAGGAVDEPRIQGVWQEASYGYVIELRLPAASVGRPGFAVVDVDDAERRTIAAVISTGTAHAEDAGVPALRATPELRQLIESLARDDTRVWIVDGERRVVARDGRLGPTAPAALAAEAPTLFQRIEELLLRPLYGLLLQQPRGNFDDPLLDAVRLEGEEVEAALAGRAAVRQRQTSDGNVVIVSAAHPIAAGGRTVAAAVIEQSTHAIRGLRQRALARLLTVTLAVFCLGAFVLLVYASRLAKRIRRLRNEAEQAIDDIGSVRGHISGRDAGDELGDLARSFSGALDRLARHTSYLKSVARRLAHELRTPIAVVRSSIDNLRMSELPAGGLVYVERAESGIARLNAILTRMSEADRLEHIMIQTDREIFDLKAVVESCLEGYRSAYPGSSIRLAAPPGRMMVTGVPDLVAQMLDKLIENAVDFSRDGAPIDVELVLGATDAVLAVSNEGPPLAPEMAGALFESMVSLRPEKSGDGPHLGLGLYIVDLIARFHHGGASAANRADGTGVVITVRFPRYVSDPA